VNDVAVRLLVVASIVLVAGIVAWIIGRFRRPPHPRVTVRDVGDRPGVVMFTSTTCTTCHEARSMLEALAIPFREVTSELESVRFEDWGVVAVPLTVVIDRDGAVVGTFTGVPHRRLLRRAIAGAGISTG
jgi:glutaredoxin